MNRIKSIAFAESTYAYLLALVLMSIPFRYAYSSITLIILLAVSLIHALYRPKVLRFGYIIPAALFLLMVLSISWSVDIHKSIRGLERQLPFLLIPLAFWMMPTIKKEQFNKALSLFAYWMALFGMVLIARAAFRYWEGSGTWAFTYHSLVDLFNLNAIYISVMTSLSLLYVLFYKQRNMTSILTLCALGLFLFLLASKNVIAITAVCIVLGFLLGKGRSIKRWLIVGVMGVVVGTSLFIGPIKNRWKAEIGSDIHEALTCEGFTDVYIWTGTSFRVFQARVFFELMQEQQRWLTGFGINAVQEEIAKKQDDYFLYCGYNEYNFHNQYIQTFAELGIIGFFLLIALLWVLLRLYLKHRDPFLLFVFLIITFIFFTETYIWRQRGMFHFLIIFGMLVSMYPFRKKRTEEG